MIEIKPNNGIEVMECTDGQACLGYALFRITERTMEIIDAVLFEPDARMIDGLLRSVLNAGLHRGCEEAFCIRETLFPALSAIGLATEGNKCTVALQTLFKKCTNC